MPNGRSSGFQISIAKFREVLQGIPGEITIGSQFGVTERRASQHPTLWNASNVRAKKMCLSKSTTTAGTSPIWGPTTMSGS